MKRLRDYLPAMILIGLAWSLAAQDTNPFQRAVERAQAGEITEAITITEDEIDRLRRDGFPVSPQALTLLGSLYLEASRPADALEILAPVAEEHREPATLYHTGRALVELGRFDEADEVLETAALSSPLSPASRLLGLLRISRGQVLDGYGFLRTWLLSNSDDVTALVPAARIATDLGRRAEAETLAELLPDGGEKSLFRARLLELRGDLSAAEAAYRGVVADDSIADEIRTEATHRLAALLVRLGRAEEARAQLRDVSPGSLDQVLLSAPSEIEGGDLAGVISVLERVIERLEGEGGSSVLDQQRKARAHFLLARAYRSGERPDDAIEQLRRSLELDDWNHEAWSLLGEWASDESAAAIANAMTEPEDSGSDTARAIERSRFWLGVGEPERAARVARQEQLASPYDPRPSFLLVEAELAEGDLAGATSIAETTLERFPESADAHYQLGIVRMAQDRVEDAEPLLREAIALSAEHTAAMNDLAVLLLARGEVEEAIALLERVLLLRPGDERARENLEAARQQQG